jgi:hypothetical protein
MYESFLFNSPLQRQLDNGHYVESLSICPGLFLLAASSNCSKLPKELLMVESSFQSDIMAYASRLDEARLQSVHSRTVWTD